MRKSALVLSMICVAAVAQALPIFSDGFNNPPTNPFSTVASGGTIGPWTVGLGGVDLIGSYWQPAEGNGSVDLSGNAPGSVSTTLSTLAGVNYIVSFYMAGNPDNGGGVKSLEVQVGNLLQTFTFDTAGHSLGSMGWVLESASFTAAGNDTLTFRSLVQSAYGPALDGVTVSAAIPEPATLVLFGFGLVGIGLLRRRR